MSVEQGITPYETREIYISKIFLNRVNCLRI